mgnify:CR=1 FL=1|jgi:hypothetical protein
MMFGSERGWLCAADAGGATETFSEDMLVRPLPDGNVLTHLNFRLTWPYPAPPSCVAGGGESDCAHFNIFPKVGVLACRSCRGPALLPQPAP